MRKLSHVIMASAAFLRILLGSLALWCFKAKTFSMLTAAYVRRDNHSIPWNVSWHLLYDDRTDGSQNQGCSGDMIFIHRERERKTSYSCHSF